MSFVGVSAEQCGSASLRQECGDFAWSIALNRFVLILMSSYAVYHNWQYKRQFLSYIIPDILVTLLWILVGFMPSEDCCDKESGEECPINSCWTPFIVCWWSAIFVDFFKALMPLWWFRLKLIKCRTELMAFNLPLLVERYELFVIISIGEVVAASLASESVSSEGAEDDDHHRFLEVRRCFVFRVCRRPSLTRSRHAGRRCHKLRQGYLPPRGPHSPRGRSHQARLL